MMVYNFRIASTATLAAGTNIFLLLTNVAAGTSRSAIITEIDFEGAGTSSGYAEIGLYRLSAAATAGTAVTGVPIDSPSSAPTASTTGSTAPTGGTVSALVHSFGINGNGQRYFWRANPNLNNAIVVPPTTAPANAIMIQCIAINTAPVVSGRIQIAEF